MSKVTCVLCDCSLRSDVAFKDAKWETFYSEKSKKIKVICRDCVKKLIQAILDDY